MTFGWDSFDRMVSASDRKMQASYRYDALGRRISKHTQPHVAVSSAAGSGYRDMLRARLKAEHGYGLTVYGWDGDTLACELDCEQRATTHYIYEPGSFTPMMLARGALVMDSADAADAPDVPDTPQPFTALAYYHCDQIGTPRELTDASGEVAWNAYYQAWGKAHEAISEAARKAGIANPLRFAGQYFDRETGLHYNRHRYYDPGTGRFVSKDPIGLAGGINVYAYAPNPTGWVDPLGLARKCQLGTYGALTGKANSGDGLDTHEFVRNEALEQMGLTPEGVRNKANPSIALPRSMHTEVHKNESVLAVLHLKVGRDEFQFGPDGLPTKRQMDVWQGALRQAGVPASRARELRKQAQSFLSGCPCPCN